MPSCFRSSRKPVSFRFGRNKIRNPIEAPVSRGPGPCCGGHVHAYYQWRVTQNPFKSPYVANRELYGWPENLAILPPVKLTYRHKILENMEALELSRRSRYLTLGRILDNWSARTAILWEFYIGPGLTLALVAALWTLRSRKRRTMFWIALFMWVSTLFSSWHIPSMFRLKQLFSTFC